jgi:polysaccharide export outer membrane protein
MKKRFPMLIVVSLAGVSLFATDSAPQSTWQPASTPFAGPTSKEQQESNSASKVVKDPNAARAPEKLASTGTPGSKAYRIGLLDVLDVSVFQAPELSKTVEVDEKGDIDLPLVGEIRAAGKTALELQHDLNSRLGAKYLQNPQVTVIVKEFNSSRVTVSGAVKNPGVFPYKGQTLLQFVTMAGGLAFEANSTIIVLRGINGQRSTTTFNVADITAGRAPDPPVQAGDLIVADSSTLKTGYTNLLKYMPLTGAAGTASSLAR